jgi:hypothetical protein
MQRSTLADLCEHRELFECSPLRQRNDLRVDVHRGRNAGVTHLTLNRLRVGARPVPSQVAWDVLRHRQLTNDSPSAFGPPADMPSQNVLVIHRFALLNALKN